MLVKDSDTGSLLNTIERMDLGKDEVLMILLGEKDSLDVQGLIAGLNDRKINFFGGMFPGVIFDNEKHDHGVILAKLPAAAKPVIVGDLRNAGPAIQELTAAVSEAARKPTALVLIDGLAGDTASFLEDLYNRLANSVNYFGGGAGSLSLKQQPCLFTRNGFLQDAAVVTLIDAGCSLGVRHGWTKVAGPVVVTRSEKNIIYELNWRNAFEVYKEIVENDLGGSISADNFFEIAKGYPFGMIKQYAEKIVRDPLALGERGELICVGEVPENAVVDILRGDKENLIEAAGQAASDCGGAATGKIKLCFIADCISRVLFLEDDFPEELARVKEEVTAVDEELVPVGMLTLGEISSFGEGFLEFFNKTIVVAMFYE